MDQYTRKQQQTVGELDPFKPSRRTGREEQRPEGEPVDRHCGKKTEYHPAENVLVLTVRAVTTFLPNVLGSQPVPINEGSREHNPRQRQTGRCAVRCGSCDFLHVANTIHASARPDAVRIGQNRPGTRICARGCASMRRLVATSLPSECHASTTSMTTQETLSREPLSRAS